MAIAPPGANLGQQAKKQSMVPHSPHFPLHFSHQTHVSPSTGPASFHTSPLHQCFQPSHQTIACCPCLITPPAICTTDTRKPFNLACALSQAPSSNLLQLPMHTTNATGALPSIFPPALSIQHTCKALQPWRGSSHTCHLKLFLQLKSKTNACCCLHFTSLLHAKNKPVYLAQPHAATQPIASPLPSAHWPYATAALTQPSCTRHKHHLCSSEAVALELHGDTSVCAAKPGQSSCSF